MECIILNLKYCNSLSELIYDFMDYLILNLCLADDQFLFNLAKTSSAFITVLQSSNSFADFEQIIMTELSFSLSIN